ncbi:DUF3192 domain-containing protein [uncultured Ferrimonas sp.]|uniref:DUF3192 domain-containing protein n=1 Tax=uncultured Ferrimonas sp. TaxID=432640 RepID=UPI00261DC71E|nr:DUF3192 domain-containing protein [uncultured Ferrimonas sp.]
MKKLNLFDLTRGVSFALLALLLLSLLYGIWRQQQPTPEPLDWLQLQQRNAALIAQLQYGKGNLDILDKLGSADFTDAHTDQLGQQWLLLRYRTHHRSNDGFTSLDETTPLLFKNGKLVEWGETAAAKFAISRNQQQNH